MHNVDGWRTLSQPNTYVSEYYLTRVLEALRECKSKDAALIENTKNHIKNAKNRPLERVKMKVNKK